MKLIIGLGNVGEEYKDTRHNIGFMVVEKLANELGRDGAVAWSENKKSQALIAKVGDVVLVKPTTLMNNSGIAVKSLMDFYKLQPEDVWVIHDDMDLPLGKLRIREKGASGGHNGIESVMTSLGTDLFIRYRMGIGRGKEENAEAPDVNMKHRTVINYVLSRFTDHEAGDVRKLVKHGVDAVRMSLTDGLDKAMNRFN